MLELEIAQVLRRFTASGDLDQERAQDALTDLSEFPLTRYQYDLFLPRIWELGFRVTAYDAVYLA
ncbi:MAG: type II toxin-antitoxin system VapC family toxin [Nitrospirae bacterium]|nr:type II toxin-antitoxin system VapC family toxin [Nitrospirota bacterium]MDA1305157.1 type II toxin-antitoxin system VapC family toxin [Nitrospirota bacterium]